MLNIGWMTPRELNWIHARIVCLCNNLLKFVSVRRYRHCNIWFVQSESNVTKTHMHRCTRGDRQPITWKPFEFRLRGFSDTTFSFPSTTFIRLSVFLTYCRSRYVRRSSTSIDWLMFWTWTQRHTPDTNVTTEHYLYYYQGMINLFNRHVAEPVIQFTA